MLCQRLIEPLELDSRVCRCKVRRTEARRANQDVVSKRSQGRLLPSIVAVAHRAALHENNWLMAVLPRGRSGEAGHVARFGAAGGQVKASRREKMGLRPHTR